MQYGKLGASGLVVSRFGFGVMTFGTATDGLKGVWKTGQETANELVGHALNAGITYFDTADAYSGGESETMLGKALGARRRDVVISTKIGFRVEGTALLAAGLSYRRVFEAVEDSLRRLSTDYIDVLSLHVPDPYTPLDETLRALEDLVRRGWARYVGYSNYPVWQAATMLERQRARGYSPMAAAQMYYSLLGRDLELAHLPFARASGVGTVVWSPLAGGFLSGRYSKADPGGGGGRLADFDFIPMDKKRAYDAVESIRRMAQQRGCSVPQLALAWLLTKEVDVVLLGSSKAQQLEENLGALDVHLSAAEIETLDAIAPPALPYPAWYLAKIGGDPAVAKALSNEDIS
jgi:aryl-alcohol dehydrogenase-like predicted oxidoreductase